MLLWASRTMGDTFWHEQIAALKEAYGDRFDVQTILSRERREGSLHGRVNPDVLREVFEHRWQTGPGGKNESRRGGVRFLSVGTKQMMKGTDAMLQDIGYGGFGTEHALLR